MIRSTMNPVIRLMIVAFAAGLVGGGPLVAGQTALVGQTKTITITVDDPRPMAAAVEKLEELSGIPINYEDMPVYSPTDLRDVTDTVARTPLPPGRRLTVARGGQLSLPISVDAATGKLSGTQAVERALQELVVAYNSSGLPGGFDYEFYHGVFFVWPIRYRDVNGVTQPMNPILSVPITLPEERRNSLQTIRLILAQVSQETGGLAIFPATGVGGLYDVTFGAQAEPANRVIARYLAGVSGTAVIASWDQGLSYQFYCEGNYFDGKLKTTCALNTGRVPNSPRWAPRPAGNPVPAGNPIPGPTTAP